ncbi:DUF3300 domain-containing protein [Desulfobacula sp.]|uniref:DUF3300 domain-containing protein n=1 Tax=Desulfobacula sp. TaxID=2593537 RepID=UPI0026034FFF|nr:DUF3300 domain-containing protein [Desulfobacula sp.]
MKTTTIYHPVPGLFILVVLIFCFVLPLRQVHAQDSSSPESSETYSQEELAQMLAPIALYPDALLSQVLMASTYPIEVIEANRWIRKNPGLKGEALNTALLDKDWDPSIKAVCHFPSIFALMSERITETTNLGNAFLAQEAEVMDMVQELRAKAYAQGNLTTNDNQKVIVEKETIIIKPADSRIIHVPYYDPVLIYGPWWYPAYRPHYWGPPGVSMGIGISYWPGFYFGFSFGSWSYFDWPHRYIYIDVHKRPRFVRHDRWRARPGRWQHAPIHRRGVVYRDKVTAKKYGQHPNRSRDFRHNTRDFNEPKTLDLHRRGDDRTRINRERQPRESVDRDRGKQTRIQRDKQERTPGDRQGQTRIKPERQGREQVNRDGQMQQRVNPERQGQKQVEYEQPQRRPDNAFNRVEDGRRGDPSSKGGRVSRPGMGDDSPRKNRSGGDSRRGHGGGKGQD